MSCCEAARKDDPVSLLARLCCKFDCNQPASTHGSSSANSLTDGKQKPSLIVPSVFNCETVLYIQQIRFPNSPTRNLLGSSNLFLETGTLRI
jgi:hypothetical protein